MLTACACGELNELDDIRNNTSTNALEDPAIIMVILSSRGLNEKLTVDCSLGCASTASTARRSDLHA
jgi:hypothetical protein